MISFVILAMTDTRLGMQKELDTNSNMRHCLCLQIYETKHIYKTQPKSSSELAGFNWLEIKQWRLKPMFLSFMLISLI